MNKGLGVYIKQSLKRKYHESEKLKQAKVSKGKSCNQPSHTKYSLQMNRQQLRAQVPAGHFHFIRAGFVNRLIRQLYFSAISPWGARVYNLQTQVLVVKRQENIIH
jgi:hypothetical protein